MLARNVGFRALRQCSIVRFARPNPTLRHSARRFSTSHVPHVEGHAPATHPLAGVASQIEHVAPRFEIDPEEIEILDGPVAFYETLKVGWTSNGILSRGD
jgi:hypothetical protein